MAKHKFQTEVSQLLHLIIHSFIRVIDMYFKSLKSLIEEYSWLDYLSIFIFVHLVQLSYNDDYLMIDLFKN